jgi:hypothetical protein
MERNHHHYFIDATETRLIIMHVSLVFASMLISYFRFKNLFRFQLISMLLIFGYYLGIEHLHSSSIASMQLYILDSWMMVLALISLFSAADTIQALLEAPLSMLPPTINKLSIIVFTLISLIIFIPISIAKLNHHPSSATAEDTTGHIEAVYAYIKENSPKDACFIYPYELSDFKIKTQRSTFVDAKAVIPDAAWMTEWKHRFTEVYGPYPKEGLNQGQKQEGMNAHISSLQLEDFRHLRQEGATHLLTSADVHLQLILVTEINHYRIYELP